MGSTITVAQISDSHLKREPGVGEGSPDEGLRRAVSLVATVKPDVLLLTGDIADDGSTDALERVAREVKVLDIPVLATAGNHDDPAAVAAVLGAVDDKLIGGWRLCLVFCRSPSEE